MIEKEAYEPSPILRLALSQNETHTGEANKDIPSRERAFYQYSN
jgi:hypothetical protein